MGTEKFDYKLKWMRRLEEHAATLLKDERPTILAGDWNVVPEDRDVFSIRAAANDALVQPETRAQWRRILNQGWTEALRAFHPDDDISHLLGYTALWHATSGFRIEYALLPEVADRMDGAASTRGEGPGEAVQSRADLV